jgi:hypothetical protein
MEVKFNNSFLEWFYWEWYWLQVNYSRLGCLPIVAFLFFYNVYIQQSRRIFIYYYRKPILLDLSNHLLSILLILPISSAILSYLTNLNHLTSYTLLITLILLYLLSQYLWITILLHHIILLVAWEANIYMFVIILLPKTLQTSSIYSSLYYNFHSIPIHYNNTKVAIFRTTVLLSIIPILMVYPCLRI